MAQERPPSPEKQLLKLIEDSKAKNEITLETRAIKHRSLSFFSFGAWLGRLSFFREVFKKRFHKRNFWQLDIKAVNNILAVCAVALGLYFINVVFSSVINLKKIPNSKFQLQEETKPTVSFSETSVLKRAVSFYLEKVRQRDIFQMGAKKPDEGPTGIVFSGRATETAKHLKLVGISWSDDPYAMVEDTKALKTFFVKRGQMIGEIKVQAIFKDKLILRYGNEEIELR